MLKCLKNRQNTEPREEQGKFRPERKLPTKLSTGLVDVFPLAVRLLSWQPGQRITDLLE